MALNVTYVGVGIRNRCFLCMCSRNFFFNFHYCKCCHCCGDVSKLLSDGNFFGLLLV